MLEITETRSHEAPLAQFRQGIEPASGIADVPNRLAREVDMTWHVLEQLSDLVGHKIDDIAAEVPCAASIADIAAIEFDTDEIDRRKALGVGPICSTRHLRALDQVSNRRVSKIDTLCARIGANPQTVARTTLAPLAELGMLEYSDCSLQVSEPWRPISRSVTTIELKLDDWRGALAQARSQARSADFCWAVVRDRRPSTVERMRIEFAAHGIGLATLGDSGELRIVSRPRKQRPARWLRGITAEWIWHLTSK